MPFTVASFISEYLSDAGILLSSAISLHHAKDAFSERKGAERWWWVFLYMQLLYCSLHKEKVGLNKSFAKRPCTACIFYHHTALEWNVPQHNKAVLTGFEFYHNTCRCASLLLLQYLKPIRGERCCFSPSTIRVRAPPQADVVVFKQSAGLQSCGVFLGIHQGLSYYLMTRFSPQMITSFCLIRNDTWVH